MEYSKFWLDGQKVIIRHMKDFVCNQIIYFVAFPNIAYLSLHLHTYTCNRTMNDKILLRVRTF